MSLFFSMDKKSEVYRRNNNRRKELPFDTHDTTLRSCSDILPPVRAVLYLIETESIYTTPNLLYTHQAELIENSQMVYPINRCAEVILHNIIPLSNAFSLVWEAENSITGTNADLSDQQSLLWPANYAVGSTPLSFITNRHLMLKHLRP